jgi:hypothetical protein
MGRPAGRLFLWKKAYQPAHSEEGKALPNLAISLSPFLMERSRTDKELVLKQ